MSLLTAIEGFFEKAGAWFSHVFGVAGKDIQIALTNVGPLVSEAETIITEISTVIAGVNLADPNAVLTKIEGYLTTTIKDTTLVSSFITTNTGIPLANLLGNVATFVLGHTSGTSNVILKDLQLAVQLAYAAFSAKNPTTTGSQTVANIATPTTVKH